MMKSSIYLGDEPLFEQDPFISDGMAPEQHDHLFQDLFKGTSFDTGTYDRDAEPTREEAEAEEPQFHELGSFHFDEPNLYSLDISDPHDIFAVDERFGLFDFEAEPEVAPVEEPLTPDLNDQDWRLGQIIDEVAAVPAPEPVVKKRQTVPKPKVEPPKQVAPVYNGMPPNRMKFPVASVGPLKKPKCLFPVKVKRIVPQQPRILTHGRNPYALQPVPPRAVPSFYPHSAGTENKPSLGYFRRGTEVLRKKALPIIPRDRQSNQIRCHQCHSAFTTELALEFHEVERHSNSFAFECTECDKVFGDIRDANKHLVEEHKKNTVPLLDSSIFGNGDVSEMGKKGSQRRFSGMIWSFLKNHLAQSGKLKGTPEEDNEIVRKEVKAVFNPNNKPEKAHLLNEEGVNVDEKACIGETASINDLLKREYIYGPFIRRVSINSVPSDKVIRRRYVDVPPADEGVANNVIEEKETHIPPPPLLMPQAPQPPPPPPQLKPITVVRPTYQLRPNSFPGKLLTPGAFATAGALIGSEIVKKTAFVQKPSPTGATTTHYYGSVYLAKSAQGTFVLTDKPALKRIAARSDSAKERKLIKVEMPPLLEHYAAHDKPAVAPKPVNN